MTKTFLDEKARFAPILKTFPLFVVLNENLGLLGCRQYALKLLVCRLPLQPPPPPPPPPSPPGAMCTIDVTAACSPWSCGNRPASYGQKQQVQPHRSRVYIILAVVAAIAASAA